MKKTIEYRDLAGEVRQERFAQGIQRALLDDGTMLVVGDDGSVAVLSRREADRYMVEHHWCSRLEALSYALERYVDGEPPREFGAAFDTLAEAVRTAQRAPCHPVVAAHIDVVEYRGPRRLYVCWHDGELTPAGRRILAEER